MHDHAIWNISRLCKQGTEPVALFIRQVFSLSRELLKVSRAEMPYSFVSASTSRASPSPRPTAAAPEAVQPGEP